MVSDSKKVILTGNFSVGKTSIFNKFIHDQFSEKYLTTIGVTVNKKVVNIGSKEVSLLLWDIAGEVHQNKVPNTYFLGASGVIYVFDLTRSETYLRIKDDMDHLKKMVPNAVFKVVGNKKDLLDADQLEAVLSGVEAEVDITTSAKTGENIAELFQKLGKEVS